MHLLFLPLLEDSFFNFGDGIREQGRFFQTLIYGHALLRNAPTTDENQRIRLMLSQDSPPEGAASALSTQPERAEREKREHRSNSESLLSSRQEKPRPRPHERMGP